MDSATITGKLEAQRCPTFRMGALIRLGCVALAAITSLTALNAGAQEFAPIQLDAPILPEGPAVGMAPIAHGPAATGVPTVPIGSSVGPEVMQTSFTGCTSCGSIGCGGCDEFAGPGFACPPSSIGLWVRADYLVWYAKESDVIPLVTTSTDFTADPGDLLTLGAAETRVLVGGDNDDNPLDGFRIEVGTWLDAAATFGIMGRYFEVGDSHSEFSAGPDDFNFLGIPFFNTDIGGEDAFDLTIENERRGFVSVTLDGDVKNWEILFRRLGESGCNYRRDWLFGYRNFSLSETLRLNAGTIVDTPPAGSLLPVGTRIDLTDQFDVENRFHGLDVGMTGYYHQGQWSMDYLAKIALGAMEHEIDISGNQQNDIPGQSLRQNVGGLFSQETNIGKNDETDFAVIPEFNVNLGYGVTPNLDLTVGYTFIWVSSVSRAGSSIDRSIDEGLIFDLNPINSDRPQVNYADVSYFLHGLNLGLTGRF